MEEKTKNDYLNEDPKETAGSDTVERSVMRDCNDCSSLWPKENEPSVIAPHRCRLAKKIVSHAGQHPLLPTPDWCPKNAKRLDNQRQETKTRKDELLAAELINLLFMLSIEEGNHGTKKKGTVG